MHKKIGCYILILNLKNDSKLKIGKLGEINFSKGNYIYVGSALNGLDARIQRHLKKEKKNHWHIDYLLKKADIIDIFYKQNNVKEECEIARKIENSLEKINRFGCSDCDCKSHLFYGSFEKINELLFTLNMNQYVNKKY
jgi:Uri superfamily endonuclease